MHLAAREVNLLLVIILCKGVGRDINMDRVVHY